VAVAETVMLAGAVNEDGLAGAVMLTVGGAPSGFEIAVK